MLIFFCAVIVIVRRDERDEGLLDGKCGVIERYIGFEWMCRRYFVFVPLCHGFDLASLI